MKKRRHETQRNNHPTQKRDHIIATDGFIPNSVIRAKIKGTTKSQEMPNRMTQLPVSQIYLKRNIVEQTLAQSHSETTSSASTFYWESDPDDERIGPRTKEIFEESLPEAKALDVIGQSEREESGTSEGFAMRNQPDMVQVVEEESRKSEDLAAEKELKPEKDDNWNYCGFSNGDYSEHSQPSQGRADETGLWKIPDETVTENIGINYGKFQPDEDLLDTWKTIRRNSGNDEERNDTGSDTNSSVTLEHDDTKENDLENLCSAALGPAEQREGEEKRRQASVLSITLENASPRNRTPVEHLSVAVEEPDNLEDRHDTCKETTKRQPVFMRKTRASYEKDSQSAARYATTCQVTKVPSLQIWRRGKLLPNNPAMYRMYKKRHEILNSISCHMER